MKHREIFIEFGMRVRIVREVQGITQEDLAKKTSVGRTSIVNIECGRQGASIAMLLDLAKALGVKPSRLLPPENNKRK